MKTLYTLLIIGLSLHLHSQVANDMCADAIPIGEVQDLDFTTIGATTDGPLHIDSPCPSNTEPEIDSIYNDVWYLYTPTFSGNALFSTCGTADFDTKIAAYVPGSACPPTDEDLLSCNEDGTTCAESTSELIFEVTAGESYLLRLGGYGELPPGLEGQGTFSVGEFISTVANDFCNQAIEIDLVTNFGFDSFGAITDGPSHEDSQEACFGFNDLTIQADIWYSFTPDFTGSVLWSTCGTVFFDTRLGVYGPDVACADLTSDDLYGCNDDGPGCPDFSSSMFFEVEEGRTYLLRLGGFGGETGSGTFNLTREDAPDPPANDFCENAIPIDLLEPGSTLSVEGTTTAATFNPAEFIFPPCLTNMNGGEFAEVWYSFNNNGNEELQLNFLGLTPNSSFFIDIWEDCTTPTDTLTFIDNCVLLDGELAPAITDTLGLFADTPTDYIMRVTTRLTDDIPGDFSFQLIGEGPSNVNDLDMLNGHVHLFPNPVTSVVNLNFPLNRSTHLMYTITDALGQTMMQENIGKIAGNHSQQIDIDQLGSGLYFINISLNDQPLTLRFIKE